MRPRGGGRRRVVRGRGGGKTRLLVLVVNGLEAIVGVLDFVLFLFLLGAFLPDAFLIERKLAPAIT